MNKKILDVCCGGRMFWFDKKHPDAIYMDKRKGAFISTNGYENVVNPDIQASFTNIPFSDETFSLVVFDPPHRTDLGNNSWMQNQYGKLFPGWEEELKSGFSECFRVLKTGGVLVFKWNEKNIKLKRILELTEQKPLFGHSKGQTIWMTFMK